MLLAFASDMVHLDLCFEKRISGDADAWPPRNTVFDFFRRDEETNRRPFGIPTQHVAVG